MRKMIIALLAALGTAMGVSVAGAATINLFEWKDSYDAGAVVTDSLTATGIGTYTISYTGAGSHFGGLYLDFEIDEPANTFFNEFGAAGATPSPGQSWEIDEPGFGQTYTGDIYDNFLAGTLDNTIFDDTFFGPEDVAMAMFWDFVLAAGETADLVFTTSLTPPDSGFYLAQRDMDSDAELFFYGTLTIEGGGEQPIPEPSTLLLLGAGVAALALYRRKKVSG